MSLQKRKAAELNEHCTWQELTTGLEIYEGGTSRLTMTGEWRSRIPVWHPDICKQCLLCVPFCPDSSIPVYSNYEYQRQTQRQRSHRYRHAPDQS